MVEKKLLFTSFWKDKGFMKETSKRIKGDKYSHYDINFIEKFDFWDIDDLIKENNGFVFFGPQTSKKNPNSAVFSSLNDYYAFVSRIHQKDKYVAGVLRHKMVLPGNNDKIDFVLDGDKSSPLVIASELEKFFQNPKYYLEMVRKSKEKPLEDPRQPF